MRTPRESGLDTSNGLEFVQQRIGLFAKIIAFIALAFLIAGAVGQLALQMAGSPAVPVSMNSVRGLVAHVAGLVLLIAVWLLCRWRRFQLNALEWLDAVALVGASGAWALFIEPPVVETIHGAVVSVAMTVLARSIMVPSKAARTLRLTALAVLPVTAIMWFTRSGFAAAGPANIGPRGTLTVVFQTLSFSR